MASVFLRLTRTQDNETQNQCPKDPKNSDVNESRANQPRAGCYVISGEPDCDQKAKGYQSRRSYQRKSSKWKITCVNKPKWAIPNRSIVASTTLLRVARGRLFRFAAGGVIRYGSCLKVFLSAIALAALVICWLWVLTLDSWDNSQG